uniref:Secreted protein n=1 Tax=Paramormyrops kingsleyae TaxID=1676925 RepID=A0A3B3RQ35_9TELE
MCCFFVFLLSLFSFPPEQHSVPHRQEGEPGSSQFGRPHDHVSFSCAIPTHPISKTTSQFHQPYSYSLPPLQSCPFPPPPPPPPQDTVPLSKSCRLFWLRKTLWSKLAQKAE